MPITTNKLLIIKVKKNKLYTNILVLKPSLNKISKTVIKTKKSITLEPMSAFERKIIHTKLQDNDKVKTFSKGEEPHRRLVISLK